MEFELMTVSEMSEAVAPQELEPQADFSPVAATRVTEVIEPAHAESEVCEPAVCESAEDAPLESVVVPESAAVQEPTLEAPVIDASLAAAPVIQTPVVAAPVVVESLAPIVVARPVLKPKVVAPVAVTPAPAAPVAAAVESAEVGEPVNGFRKLGLSDALMQAIEESGYTNPTPIQEQTIALLLAGRDMVGQAQTGSGKTGAFALPMLQRIDTNIKHPQVLVLVPTRELAIQVAAAFEKYAAKMSQLRVVAIYGGAAYQPQLSQLKRGVQVVVGTPGRVMDHMNRGSLNLTNLKCLVLDEADEMLRMGFAESVEWVLTQLPAERQIALFSATMPDQIRRIAQQHLRNPAEVTIRQKTATADTIRQRFVVVGQFQKEQALGRVLEAEAIDGVIIFVKLKCTTEPLADFLNSRGYKAAALNGDIAQAQRERIIDHLKSGKLDIVVATDVAARGLDVQRISHVINYDLPGDSEAYVHRIGRTGRAGRSGEAILFIHPKAQRMLKSLEYATRQKIEPMELPSNRQINKHRVSKFHARITETMEHPLADAMGSIVEQYRRENPETPIEKIVAALAVLANNGNPLLLKEEMKQETFFENRGRDSRGPRDSRDARGPRDGGFQGRGTRTDFSTNGPRYARSPGDRGFRDDGPPREDRGFRDERQFRDDRPPREDRGPRGPRPGDENMETFRIEVGHMHQVKPGNIVGAIANEAGIDSAQIGRIEIFDEFSTVDLPQGMPQEVFFALKKVWISGRQLKIAKAEGMPTGDSSPRRPDRPFRPERNDRPGRKPGNRRVRS
jgi:ATP-dependent RNA helicase DeaD